MDSTALVETVIENSENYDEIIMYLESINGFLFRLSQTFEFFIALVITIVICVIFYVYLKYFTRF